MILIIVVPTLSHLIMLFAGEATPCVVKQITRSGAADLSTGSLRRVGLDGYYWSSTAYPDVNNAYYLSFSSADTYPSNYNARWYGFSVRCVAR